MKTKLQFLTRGILMAVLLCFGFVSCNQEEISLDTEENAQNDESLREADKIDICHYSKDDDTWFIIQVSANAWPGHSLHGDGYVTEVNECVPGGDCDDTDASVYPGATEICGDGIDQDCDGIDEGCTLAIGDDYQGGKIAYILQLGDPGYVADETHGIIAAPSDQSTDIQWYNGSFTTTEATGTALGTGQANTTAIVTSQGVGNYAAQVCNDLVLGGYDDWYLPSKDELNKLYLNRVAVGGFVNAFYWSSSEINVTTAWLQTFNNGNQYDATKLNDAYVRAVRVF